jgi:hypothetical protein
MYRLFLLYFGFVKLNVLAYNGIVFTEFELISHFAGIFLGDVEKTGIRAANQTDKDRGCFCHKNLPLKMKFGTITV